MSEPLDPERTPEREPIAGAPAAPEPVREDAAGPGPSAARLEPPPIPGARRQTPTSAAPAPTAWATIEREESPLESSSPDSAPARTSPPPIPQLGPRVSMASSPWLHFVLLVATLATTTIAGALGAGANPFTTPAALLAGLPFSLTLLAILLCHEMGHWLAARHHGVPTSLPYFIPGPPILVGTFGAFIRMRGMPRSRRALFDIGAAGPWAGAVVALPAVALGLAWSEVRPLRPDDALGLAFGNSMLFTGLTELVLGVHPDDATILLHPIAVAGWFGLFVTFLNLLPVGQLDGGHVAYALLGRGHRIISRIFVVVLLVLGLRGWDGWFLWAFLLAFVVRVDHPDTADRATGLDTRRIVAAWLTVLLFAVTFMPEPLILTEEESTPRGRDGDAPSPPSQHSPHRAPHSPADLLSITFDTARTPH